MEYAARVLFLYGLTFSLAYYGILIYGRFKQKTELMKNLLGGIIMSGVLSILFLTVKLSNISNISNMPDSSILIISYTTFFIGPVAGIFVALGSTLLISIMNEPILLILFVTQSCNIALFYLARIIIKKLNRKTKYIDVILYVIIANLIDRGVAYLLDTDKTINFNSKEQFYIAIIFEALIFCALLNMIYREKERKDSINNLGNYSDELGKQNKKIEVLYQEVFANQEELKRNFNELTRYEERIEYLAFHENKPVS